MNFYQSEIFFHLPNPFRYANIYEFLLQSLKDNPQIFKDNVKIGSIYGCPLGCIWNGGRLNTGPHLAKSQLIAMKSMINSFRVPVRFTFTNCLLEERHLYDQYGNLTLEIFSDGDNEIICNSEILEDYIRKNYGNKYKYISSTTKRLNNKQDQLKELEKDYHLIVLDYDFNTDFKFLKNIKNKDKCEILVNAVCQAKCKHRMEHYKSISQCQLDNDPSEMIDCPYASNDTLWGAMKQKNFISPKDINEIYIPMGFKNFKLEGRTAHPLDFIEIIIYYLIREEFQYEIRSKLQKMVW